MTTSPREMADERVSDFTWCKPGEGLKDGPLRMGASEVGNHGISLGQYRL